MRAMHTKVCHALILVTLAIWMANHSQTTSGQTIKISNPTNNQDYTYNTKFPIKIDYTKDTAGTANSINYTIYEVDSNDNNVGDPVNKKTFPSLSGSSGQVTDDVYAAFLAPMTIKRYKVTAYLKNGQTELKRDSIYFNVSRTY